jgi:hypothetical protein
VDDEFGNDSKGSGRGLILNKYPSIRLEELRSATKFLNQDSRSPGRDLNPRPPEYESGASTTLPRRLAEAWAHVAYIYNIKIYVRDIYTCKYVKWIRLSGVFLLPG